MASIPSLVKDVRGCMTRFDPLTPEIVSAQTDDSLTYDELKTVLIQCGMDITKVVFDGSRSYQNAFLLTLSKVITVGFPSRKRT